MNDSVANASGVAETRAFQAEVASLLKLMVHSVYSERDVFLRELISNAADACDKLRYAAIADPELLERRCSPEASSSPPTRPPRP